MKLRLGVLHGGWSSERDVSVSSAQQVMRYIDRSAYDPIAIEIRTDHLWSVHTDEGVRTTTPSEALAQIDAALLVLHGIGGEDGIVQGLLEAHGVPYTGPKVDTSAIFMDKVLSKWQFQIHQIPTPDFVCVNRPRYLDMEDRVIADLIARLGTRAVIKPARHGSSVGVSVTTSRAEIAAGLEMAFALDDRVLVERFVHGTEVQVGILGHWSDYRVLPTLELDFRDGQTWFDHETKYGTDRSRIHFHIPARVSDQATDRLAALASDLYERYRFTGYGRFDFLVPDDGQPLLLEINTITGMTPSSTYPLMAQHAGISYPDLLSELVEQAVQPSITAPRRSLTANAVPS
ncbi:D-alanine--D-alanine ligase [Kibdelosporangium philippinense]|uniref:D-alanine--D-alanine ligase n=2 Tax=Kibdelosporangium philippinense TaxID=211113 RepID=A0ABS8Z391_9PSEU|nr:D-alanine--D-alanine ligase [Kibdelosporangium philippinense]MCE7002401.1 D-alanine--D-alanine ligase [Kibdelosporangium philippinense]